MTFSIHSQDAYKRWKELAQNVMSVCLFIGLREKKPFTTCLVAFVTIFYLDIKNTLYS